MEFTQTTPSSVWTITHNLNSAQPAIDVWVDDNGVTTAILPKKIELIDANTANIIFTIPFSGTAVVVTEPTHAYTHTQSSASDEWHVVHNIGSAFLNIDVVIDNNGIVENITPQNITSIDDNQINVFFSKPYVGIARVSK